MSNYNIGQLRGAWGAGKAAAEKKMQSDGRLTGMYFHTLKDGEIHNQGKVIAKLDGEFYRVQLFEWFMGEPSAQKVVRLAEMNDWIFYESREKWLSIGDLVIAKIYRD